MSMRAYWQALRGNAVDLAGEQVFSWGPELIITGLNALDSGEGLSTDLANRIIALIIVLNRSDKVLYKQDRQETIAEIIGLLFPDRKKRQRVARFNEELIEACVRIQNAFTRHPVDDPRHPHGNPEISAHNKQIAFDVLKGAYGVQGDPMAEQNPKQNPPAGAKPAAAAPAAVPPPDSHKTIIEIVGELPEKDQQKFRALVESSRSHLRGPAGGTPPADAPITLERFERRLVRTTLPRSEIQFFVNGVKGEGDNLQVEDLQRDLFIRAVSQAVMAGGVQGRFARLLGEGDDRTADDVGRDIEGTRTAVQAATANLRRFS